MARHPHGGFTLESPGGDTVRVEPGDGGWRLAGATDMNDWTLRRAKQGRGFVLAESGREIGRTMAAIGIEGGTAPKHLLLEDGRLFRIVPCGPRTAGADLLGWETPGSYLCARPTERGFTIAPTPAAGGIPDLRVLSLLLAAEVCDADEPLEPATIS